MSKNNRKFVWKGWTECRFLQRKKVEVGPGTFREMDTCRANLLDGIGGTCHYVTIYGIDGTIECSTHALLEISETRKKYVREETAHDRGVNR